jgi:hypothetical protein
MADTKPQPKGLAANRYHAMTSDRDPYLQRARDLAALTVPSLFRQEGDNGSTAIEIPWGSLGAACVVHLAAKVVFSIFPPGAPPMKLSATRAVLDAIEQDEPSKVADLLASLNAGLSKVEAQFVECFEEDGDRAALTVGTMKQIVGGTHGYQFYPDGKIRGIGLNRFVNKRDTAGNLIEWVVWDTIAWTALPPEVREGIVHKMAIQDGDPMAPPPSVNIYTHGRLGKNFSTVSGKQWEIYQETWGDEVRGSRRTYDEDAMPYLFAPWQLNEGEDYGRPYAELYEGDLQTVEGLTQTITEGSAAAARTLTLVHPGGLTSRKQVSEADNGAVLPGRAEDVTSPDPKRAADFQSGLAISDKAEKRLEAAFLMFSSVQRDAERVTAEEIRRAAAELEQTLGGTYSQQVVTLQMPFCRLKLRYLQNKSRVTKLPKGTTKVTILGGLAALGRNAEMEALSLWGQFMANLAGPTWLMMVMTNKPLRNIAQRAAAALRIDTTGILPTDDEMNAAIQQQQTQQTLANPAAVEAIRQGGQNLTANQVADTSAEAKLATTPPPAANAA